MTKNSNPTWWRKTHFAWLACAFVLTSTFGISSIAKAESASVTTMSAATARVMHTGTTPVGSPVGRQSQRRPRDLVRLSSIAVLAFVGDPVT